MFIKHDFFKIWKSLIDPSKPTYTFVNILFQSIIAWVIMMYSFCFEKIILTCKSLCWPCNSNVDPINEYLNTKLSTPPFITNYTFASIEQ